MNLQPCPRRLEPQERVSAAQAPLGTRGAVRGDPCCGNGEASSLAGGPVAPGEGVVALLTVRLT